MRGEPNMPRMFLSISDITTPIFVSLTAIAFIFTIGYIAFYANESYYKSVDVCMNNGGEVIPSHGSTFACIKRGK